MKKLIAVAAFALLSGRALADEVKTTMDVKGWHCAGCAEETTAALKKVKGVKSVDADFDSSKIVVAYDDSKTNTAAIEKAIKKAGYTAVVPK
jgi:mercuric transport protein